MDVGAFALAEDGQAELRPAAGIVSIAFKTFAPPFAELELPSSSPGAEKLVKYARIGSFKAARRGEREHCRQGDGSQKKQSARAKNRGSHRP
jgi:hypothetical protein